MKQNIIADGIQQEWIQGTFLENSKSGRYQSSGKLWVDIR